VIIRQDGGTNVNDLQRLLDIEAIKRLKARYFRSVDTKDLDEFLSCFTDDAFLQFDLALPSRNQQSLRQEGKTGITDYWRSRDPDIRTVHQGHTPEIDLLSDTEARGIWAMEDIVEQRGKTIHGFGHYWETYQKMNGQWLIARLHLTRLRITQCVTDHIQL
jgi:hypothetical protein